MGKIWCISHLLNKRKSICTSTPSNKLTRRTLSPWGQTAFCVIFRKLRPILKCLEISILEDSKQRSMLEMIGKRTASWRCRLKIIESLKMSTTITLRKMDFMFRTCTILRFLLVNQAIRQSWNRLVNLIRSFRAFSEKTSANLVTSITILCLRVNVIIISTIGLAYLQKSSTLKTIKTTLTIHYMSRKSLHKRRTFM